MTVEEVLKADWRIAEIGVIVRKREPMEYIKEYCIGKDVRPGNSQRFLRTSKAGDVYSNGPGLEEIYIDKIIQFHQLAEKPNGKEKCWGTLLKEIPEQIRDLEIDYMYPRAYLPDRSLRGYFFDCVTDEWHGIKGEDETVEDKEL